MDAVSTIEDFFRNRYGREAIYLPSGRMALYLSFREWLQPGDRVLLSPVDDDVVFFTVLAAGLVPVVGPLDPETGNIDARVIDDSTWARLKAVLTTNLYGIPDQMNVLEERCRQHDLLLVEDACHALDSRLDGRRIGSIGPVAAFSLTKHLDGAGGILSFADAGRRDALLRRLRDELRPRSALQTLVKEARFSFERAKAVTGTGQLLGRIRRHVLPRQPERNRYRMDYQTHEVLEALRDGAGLDRFEAWVRVDNHAFRTFPISRKVSATLRELQGFEENRRRRLDGTRKLLASGLVSCQLPSEDTALFRVPLFTEKRDVIRGRLASAGLAIDYIYDPPLDEYGDRDLIESMPSPAAARKWTRDVLPVDPLRADQFLSIARQSPGLLSVTPS